MIDTLGDRMKEFYEDRFRVNLPRRTNVLIRIDGKAFHTYTKGLDKPFDVALQEDMDATMQFLCASIQGCKLGYVQSDEISLWLTDYDTVQTDAWFDYNVQKMCSIAASLATAKFNQLRLAREAKEGGDLVTNQITGYPLAMFDARVFIIPHIEEVINYFIWRQQDATRNSISMAAQSMYSHKDLEGKSSDDKQEMIFQKGQNWNDYPVRFKRGTCALKQFHQYAIPIENGIPMKGAESIPAELYHKEHPDQYKIFNRSSWDIVEIPIFSQNKEFIRNLFNVLTKNTE